MIIRNLSFPKHILHRTPALAAAATSSASTSPQEAIQQMGAAGLESFYSDDSIAAWQAVLGDKMHYHHGFFDADADANHLE